MPNKNKTACKRRIRSQRSQRQRYRTARNGGWSPLRPFREASATRRTNKVPAKWWQSPRRWNTERERHNVANEIAIQRAAAEAAITTYRNMQKRVSAQNATLNESTKLNNQIRTITEQLNDPELTRVQRNLLMAKRDRLRTAIQTLTSNTATTAVYNAVPAAAAYPYSQRMSL